MIEVSNPMRKNIIWICSCSIILVLAAVMFHSRGGSQTSQPTQATQSGPRIITCPACHGKKTVACSSCDGTGKKTIEPACPICMGTGNGWLYYNKCKNCNGTGMVKQITTCGACNGSGIMTCGTCAGKGEVDQQAAQDDALRLYKAWQDGKDSGRAGVIGAIRQWSQIEPAAAGKWIESLDGAGRGEAAVAVSQLATDWAAREPEAAAKWAECLPDTDRSIRTMAVGIVALSWGKKDPAAANKWSERILGISNTPL